MDTSELRAAIIETHKQRLREALAALDVVEGYIGNGERRRTRSDIASCFTHEWKTAKSIAEESGASVDSVHQCIHTKLKGKVESRLAVNAQHYSTKEYRLITD